MSNQILHISFTFFTKREKVVFVPGNREIGNTAKFWRDGKNGFRIRTRWPKVEQKQVVLFQDKKS